MKKLQSINMEPLSRPPPKPRNSSWVNTEERAKIMENNGFFGYKEAMEWDNQVGRYDPKYSTKEYRVKSPDIGLHSMTFPKDTEDASADTKSVKKLATMALNLDPNSLHK